jgi:hypothetical protein
MRGVTETRTSIHQSARHGKFVSFICDEGQWIILGGVWWNGVVMTVEWWLEAQEETGSAQISRFEWLRMGCGLLEGIWSRVVGWIRGFLLRRRLVESFCRVRSPR